MTDYRTMPTHTVDGPIPVARDWNALVLSLIGREVTPKEAAKLEVLARKNWTARVAAEEILGRQLSQEEVDAARKSSGN